jgi:hypothetical protein
MSPHTVSQAAPVAVTADETSYVDWPAILGGAVLAAAIACVLLTFGAAIGLTTVSAEPGEGVSLLWLGIATGLWFIWVTISSFAAGGYLAGRLRRPFADAVPDEVETRDGAHGLLVWATGALLGALLAASGVTGLVGAAASGAGAAARTASEAAAEAVGGELGDLAGRLTRGGPDATALDPATREQVSGIFTHLRDGELAPEDRAYLAQVVASRTGRTPEEASAQVDAAVAEAQRLYQQALDAAGQARRRAAAIGAFVVAATLFVSAAAAWFAATTGGDHRDRRIPFRSFGR